MMASWNVGLTALRVGAVPLLGRLVAAVGQRGARRRAARRARFLQGGLQGVEMGVEMGAEMGVEGWKRARAKFGFSRCISFENRARFGKRRWSRIEGDGVDL